MENLTPDGRTQIIEMATFLLPRIAENQHKNFRSPVIVDQWIYLIQQLMVLQAAVEAAGINADAIHSLCSHASKHTQDELAAAMIDTADGDWRDASKAIAALLLKPEQNSHASSPQIGPDPHSDRTMANAIRWFADRRIEPELQNNKQGLSAKDVAARLKITTASVYRLMRKPGGIETLPNTKIALPSSVEAYSQRMQPQKKRDTNSPRARGRRHAKAFVNGL